jgi:hypothetical protein
LAQSSIFWRSDKNALITEIRGAAANGDAARLAQLLKKAKVKYLNEGDEVGCSTPIARLANTMQFKLINCLFPFDVVEQQHGHHYGIRQWTCGSGEAADRCGSFHQCVE